MSKIKSGRIILDEGAKLALSSMYEEIKSENCVKITPSKLASWIIYDFKKSSFERNKSKIKKEHFNAKEFMKGIMPNINDEKNVKEALQKALMHINSMNNGKNKAKVEK